MVLTYDQFVLYIFLGILFFIAIGILVKNKVICSIATVIAAILLVGFISVTEWINVVEPSRFKEIRAEAVMPRKEGRPPYVVYTDNGQKQITSRILYAQNVKERVEIEYYVIGCKNIHVVQTKAVAYIKYTPKPHIVPEADNRPDTGGK